MSPDHSELDTSLDVEDVANDDGSDDSAELIDLTLRALNLESGVDTRQHIIPMSLLEFLA